MSIHIFNISFFYRISTKFVSFVHFFIGNYCEGNHLSDGKRTAPFQWLFWTSKLELRSGTFNGRNRRVRFSLVCSLSLNFLPFDSQSLLNSTAYAIMGNTCFLEVPRKKKPQMFLSLFW